MANIFFDTNYFINLYTKRGPVTISYSELEKNDLFVSTLTYHIFAYTQKIKIPNEELIESLDKFYIVTFTEEVLAKALHGPTADLEDNIQLHSGAEAESDYFLTNDEKLLNMKFFGKTKITDSLQR
jgi:predicted nucleic acid-binding protein